MQILEVIMVRNGTTNLEITIWVEDMTRKTNTALIALLGTILMGLSTWVLITLIELQTIVAMLQTEILSLDKVIGRIYSHMDRLSQ